MKHYIPIFLVLLGAHELISNDLTPTVAFRSQSRDKVRQMVGVVGGTNTTNHTHRYGMETWYGLGSIMVEYTQSFHNERIARCLFGDSLFTGTGVTTACNTSCSPSSSSECGTTILIQGSRVANRNTSAWLADYFYLPTDFTGAISFNPRIRNIIVDLDFYLGLDECASGMYFRIYGPIVNTRWDLNFNECIDNAGTNSYPQGYFAPSCLNNAALLKSFASYAKGNTIASCDDITFQPLKFAKITTCERTKTGFADLRAEFGWNFHTYENSLIGLNVQGAAPTGNRRCAEFAFAPVVGNGHHWELGAGAVAHHMWYNQEETHAFSLHFDANLTTLFKAKEQRTFDLRGKPNSRYMLASKFNNNIVNNLSGGSTPGIAGGGTAAIEQFALEYAPVANLTTLEVKVSAAIQADIVAMFNVTAGGFSWDLGYNFWARSCEKIHCSPICPPCDNSLCNPTQADQWTLKGDARMFGFTARNSMGGFPTNTAVALSATESLATINKGTNQDAVDGVGQDAYQRNFGVDNALFAFGTDGNLRLVYAPFLPAADVNSNQIKTSIQPLFINCANIDFCERSRGISHKIFTNFSYSMNQDEKTLFIGVGGFGEFGKHHKISEFDLDSSSCCDLPCPKPCTSKKNKCLDCALSQWGVWIKGGLAFD